MNEGETGILDDREALGLSTSVGDFRCLQATLAASYSEQRGGLRLSAIGPSWATRRGLLQRRTGTSASGIHRSGLR